MLEQLTKTDKKFKSIKIAEGVGERMPTEIFDSNEFVEISERAEYCAVKRLRDIVKLKLRTRRRLYTLKVEPLKAEELIKKLRCEIVEV